MFLFAPACYKQVFFFMPCRCIQQNRANIFAEKNQKNLYKQKKNRIFVH